MLKTEMAKTTRGLSTAKGSPNALIAWNELEKVAEYPINENISCYLQVSSAMDSECK